MKPPEHRLHLASYPFHVELQTRFGDMDALRHVNNVAIAGLYEDARVRFTKEQVRTSAASEAMKSWNPFVVHHAIDYLAEVRYPAPVVIAMGVSAVGRTSLSLGCALFQEGSCRSLATCTMVLVDIASHRPTPVTAELRAVLEQLRVAEAPPS